jgi:hypothetical protein
MIVRAYFGSWCTKFHIAGWTCWFFNPFIWVVYLAWCNFTMGSNNECASDFVQISEKVRRRTWQRLDVRGREHELYTGIWMIFPNSPKKKKQKSKIKSMLIGFVWHQGDCSQEIRYVYYCDVLRQQHENGKQFAPNIGDKINSCCIMKTCPLILHFSLGNFWP